ncbi:A-kinase anchor protein 10, mitochondrial [Drosophila grimshawi]|uniref:GH10310 n=1 Tax=Drosophila grimshawi TaxID=7222 RepID=B4JAC6_DROGR|nr:A-kinase anchor protein 10, mitochondrial [Drosophila grimshawi]EDW03797.1 GH10310 [Drosophila grimshawi]
MLKYIKRQTSRRRSSHDTDANNEDDDVVDCAAAAQKRHSLRSTTSFCDEVFMEEEAEATLSATSDAVSLGNNSLLNVGPADEDIFKYSSRLSMTLTAIVSEPDCLSYFVQYLEAQQALPLIKFYLDIENFKRAALNQLQQQKQQQRPNDLATEAEAAAVDAQQQEEEEAPAVNGADEENDVPELKTLCDLSMRKPLTDDEKSRIYAETSKQMNNKPATTTTMTCRHKVTTTTGQQSISAASINDAIAIYQKYLIVNAPLMVDLPIVILAHISLLLCGKGSDKPIPASCFDEARDYVLQQLEQDHLQCFRQSSYYCKYCVELIEGNAASLNIYDVLYDELALFYLTEYLEQQQERECLEFWITAINFRKSYDDQRVAQSDAMIIYDRYFSLQSECRLWMSQKLRLRVEQAICAPGQLAQAFDLALLVTAKYLEQKYFAAFLKSHIFDKYVNELKLKTCPGQASDDATNSFSLPHKLSLRGAPKLSAQQQRRHRKTMSMSDCTPISQHNTLLAGQETTHKPMLKSTTTTTGANMNIDARQLTNPQLLWQRPVSALKFGHVNSLGRYERDFEAVDAVATHKAPAWSLSVKNAMRKLVNLPEDNVQEEIAWQVAEMIVKDVTSVTLHGKH